MRRYRSIQRSVVAGALCLAWSATPAVAQPAEVTPPRVLTQVEAAYPPAAIADRRGGTVVLIVTIDVTGTVADAQVAESASTDLDAAAIEAVRNWKFDPARRGAAAIASKIRVPIRFVPPPPEARPIQAPKPEALAAPAPSPPEPSRPGAAVNPSAPAEPPPVTDVTVTGRRPPPTRGASDYHVEIGALAVVPRQNATELLKLAPGVFLTNEGGEGHAERVYLRGFDAREGQDVAFSVDGVPINESGNLHGSGFADLHFILPELVSNLRVLEGPFDPRQGNYAVAGSADYQLGLGRRGLTAQYSTGSFGTQRMVLLFGPVGESVHTFAGADISTTDGFGPNRDARHATAMGQYEGKLGAKGSFRVAGAAYANEYHSAGLLRQDDVDAGRKGVFDTYDFGQGGGGSRYQLSGDLETRAGDTLFHLQLFAIRRGMRLRENYTGFLLDPQDAIQEPHDQRGDLFDLDMDETTIGTRGYAQTHGTLFGQRQELELGYFARGDDVHAVRQRVEAGSGVPYKTETDLTSRLADIGLYGDATLRAASWLALRGGARADLFAFDVLDACAVQDVSRPSSTKPPGDTSCLDQQRFGKHREPNQRSSTASVRLMPRASLLVGPFDHFQFSLSYGTGVRSMDPNYITQDIETPFASIAAYEGGVSYARSFETVQVAVRSVFFGTHVDRDLVFSESEGRAVLGSGTTRAGWVGSARVTGRFFDENANVTMVKSWFDDTGLLVPYVPDVVLRSDTALFHDLPFTIAGSAPKGTVGTGVTFIGERALPYGQRSDTIFTIDASGRVEWKSYELGFSVTNVLDRRYRLAEYNYVSDFHSAPAPTLVATRHVAAGAPRTFLVTLSATFGGDG